MARHEPKLRAGADVDRPAISRSLDILSIAKKSGAPRSAPDRILRDGCPPHATTHATLGVRLRELRWKNSAWLATAETIAGWNGFEIRKAGSGRSPVRKRSG
jgi:hypothetical protein